MENNVILQVVLNDDNAVQISVGGSDKLPPLLLVGILEQVKMQILTETNDPLEKEVYNPNQSYEA
jgi:hypothetical protein